MKRAVICICIVLLAAGCIYAIARPSNTAAPGQYADIPKGQKDLTVLPEFVYNPESISTGTVLELVSFQGAGPEPESQLKEADTVIQGSIRNIYYTFIDGQAWTQADINVLKSIEGGLVRGNTVSVYYPGGYVSAEDYSAYYGGRTIWEGSFLYFEPNELPLPKEGESGTYYLIKADKNSPIPIGAYEIIKAE